MKNTSMKSAIVFIAACLLFANFSFSQSVLYSGTYTVGGDNPDFPNVSKAVGALRLGIINGPVVLKIRPGTYSGKIQIPKFVGTSASKTVTFTSESGNASDVIITAGGTTVDTSGYTLNLFGAENIILDKITIKNTGTGNSVYGQAVLLNLGAYNNTIKGCIIELDSTFVPASSITSLTLYGIRTFFKVMGSIGNSNNSTKTNIDGCTIRGGHYGIYLDGNNNVNNVDPSNTIKNNTISKSLIAGIYSNGQYLNEVSNNRIFTRPFPPEYRSVTGINISNCDTNFVVNANYIHGDTEHGINLNSCNPTKKIIVSNNKLIVGSNASTMESYGIRITNSDLVHVVYNSVVFLNTEYSSEGRPAAFSYSGSSALIGNVSGPLGNFGNVVKNNIFYCPTGAWVYNGRYNVGLDSLDHNCVFTSGTKFSYWTNGNTAADFAGHKTVSGKDLNSISINPEFLSMNTLKTNHELINGGAQPRIYVDKDFDGDQRDPLTPDIGADEFPLILFDAMVLEAFPKSLKMGENEISFTLKNVGLKSINDSVLSLSYSADNGLSWSTPETFIPKKLGLQNDVESFVFQNKLNISVSQSYQICIRINPNGFKSDQDVSNNSICINPCVGLMGVYSVGGQFSNFLTIQSAIDALIACGIAGPTTFNIQPGQYREIITIPEFLGSNSKNILTIQSATGNRNDVKLYYDQTTYSRGLLFLEGAKYVHIKNLTLENFSANGVYYVLEIGKGASYNVISNCDILSDTVNNGTNNAMNYIFPVIFTEYAPGYLGVGSDAHYNVLENNYIKGGMVGVQVFGSSSASKSSYNIIRNNKIVQSNLHGIKVSNQKNFVAEGNDISMRTHNNKGDYVEGIYLSDVSGFTLSSNKIIGALKTGMALYSCDTVAGPNLVHNNMIGGGFGNNTPQGVRMHSSTGVKFYHNSILLDGTSSTGQVMNFEYCNGLKIKNNIFYAKNSGSIFQGSSTSVAELNNNNSYYPGSTKFANWNNKTIKTLQEFKDSTGFESLSIGELPGFVSDSNLHVQGSNMKKVAQYLASVPKDIDGEIRNTSQTFLGADEFLNINLEALLLAPTTVQTGENQVALTIINKGFGTLVDSSLKLSFSTDKGTTWQEQTFISKSLNGFNAQETFVFDNKFNVPGPGDYKICARISPPGYALDPVRDKEEICNDVCVGLSGGIFSIGGTNPDFTSIKEAIDFLPKGCGIGGPIVFNLRSGTYTEPFQLNRINGTSSINTITFQAESGNLGDVKIQNVPGNNFTAVLNGSNYTTFKNLQFVNSSQNGAAIYINGGATNNTIEHCLIQVDSVSMRDSLNGIRIVNTSSIATLVNKNNTIKNNILSGGGSNIYNVGSSSINFYDDGLLVEGNTLRNAHLDAIHVERVNNLNVNKNFINLHLNNEYSNGVFVDNTNTTLNINENTILRPGNSGITVFNGKLTSGLIANNMIGGLYKNSGIAYGIDLEDCKNIKVLHNSVNLDVNTSFTAAFATRNSKSIESYNNIWSNKGQGYSTVVENADSTFKSDYNDHYSNGSVLASYNETVVNNLAELKTTSEREANSISIEPGYLSSSNLHTLKEELDKKGKYFSIVKKDIDGQLRDTITPDIGADEFKLGKDGGVTKFTAPVNNIEITKGDSVEIKVELKNFGTQNLSSFDVNLKSNGTEVRKLNYSAGLAIGGTNTFSLGFYKPSDTGTFQLCSKTFVEGDLDATNDEKCISIKVKALPPPIIKDGFMMSIEEPKDTLTRAYGQEKSIRVKIKNVGNIAISNFELSYKINGGAYTKETYTKTLAINQEDTYTFTKQWTILDSGKTNVCAKISVVDDNNGLNDEICKETKVSYPTKTGVADIDLQDIKIYPNPASDFLIIENVDPNQKSYTLYNVLGAMVLEGQLIGNQVKVNLNELQSGIYFIKIGNSEKSVLKKIVLNKK